MARSVFISLLLGIITLVLFLLGLSLPMHIVFEVKPYARQILASGMLNNWTAEKLDLTPADYKLLKQRYSDFIKKNRNLKHRDDSSESSSSEEDDSMTSSESVNKESRRQIKIVSRGITEIDNIDNEEKNETSDDVNNDDQDKNIKITSMNENNMAKFTTRHDEGKNMDNTEFEKDYYADGYKFPDIDYNIFDDDNSSKSTDDYNDNAAEKNSVVNPIKAVKGRLNDKPLRETVSVGLFMAMVCKLSMTRQYKCSTVAVPDGIYMINKEMFFKTKEFNMTMWTNLKVECLFPVVACLIGLVYIFALPKPCCDNTNLPVYFGSLAFLVCGALVFVPTIRLLMVTSYFEHFTQNELNITSKLLMPWSMVIFGFGALFALLTAVTLILTQWCKGNEKTYRALTSGNLKRNKLKPKNMT